MRKAKPPSPMLDAALNHAARGWHVFPLQPNSKAPATPNGLHDASADPAVIRKWDWEDKNIGIRTGKVSGIVVVDVDDTDDYATLEKLENACGYPVTTPSGGMHLYFQAPYVDLKNRVGLYPGIDFRAEGGYVVAPPSRLESGEYILQGSGCTMEPLPTWLLDKLKEVPKPVTQQLHSDDGVLEGGRNNYITKAAGKMQRSGILTLEGLRALNDEKCIPPLPDREVETIYYSISKYQPGDPITSNEDDRATTGTSDRGPAGAEGALLLPASDLSDALIESISDKAKVKGQSTGIDGLDKLLGGGFREKELLFLSATAKTGKSSLLIQLIYNLLSAGIPVGFASAEMEAASEVLPSLLSIHFEENAWLEPTTEERQAAYREVLSQWPLYFLGKYGNTPFPQFEQWVKDCKAKGVKYFFADHLHFLCENSEEFKLVAEYARNLKTLTIRESISLLLVVQPSQIAMGQQLDMHKLRGGSSLSQVMNALLVLDRYRGPDGKLVPYVGKLTLDAARSKLARPGSIYLQYDPLTTRYYQVVEGDVKPPDLGPVYGYEEAG